MQTCLWDMFMVLTCPLSIFMVLTCLLDIFTNRFGYIYVTDLLPGNNLPIICVSTVRDWISTLSQGTVFNTSYSAPSISKLKQIKKKLSYSFCVKALKFHFNVKKVPNYLFFNILLLLLFWEIRDNARLLIEINPPSRFDDFKIFFSVVLLPPKKERTMIIYSMFHKNNRQMQRCVYFIVLHFCTVWRKKKVRACIIFYLI